LQSQIEVAGKVQALDQATPWNHWWSLASSCCIILTKDRARS